jgi:hypothetical protein
MVCLQAGMHWVMPHQQQMHLPELNSYAPAVAGACCYNPQALTWLVPAAWSQGLGHAMGMRDLSNP